MLQANWRAKCQHSVYFFQKFLVQLSDLIKSDHFPILVVRSLHHCWSHLQLANGQFSQTFSASERSDYYSTHSTPPQSIVSSRSFFSFTKSLFCHLSRLFSSLCHISIAAPILTFIIRSHSASMSWILTLLFSSSMQTAVLILFLHVSWQLTSLNPNENNLDFSGRMCFNVCYFLTKFQPECF